MDCFQKAAIATKASLKPKTINPKASTLQKSLGYQSREGNVNAGFLKGLVTLGVLLRSNEFSKPLKLRKGKAPQGPHDPREVDPSRTAR